MSTHLRRFLLTTLLPLISACRPEKEENPPPGGPPVAPSGIPLPPEIVQATGLAAKDERLEIILLLPHAQTLFQDFQRNGLATLVSRQKGLHLSAHEAGGSASRQAEQFRAAIAARPAAIFICPVDAPALAALIVEATTAGIKVVGLARQMLGDGCTSLTFTDQRLVGRLAAETVVEALKRKAAEEGREEITGRVVQIRGDDDSADAADLANAFTEALKPHPGIILVHDAPADWKPENATQRVAEAFRLQQQFDVIFAHDDALALAAGKAATEAGQRENIFIIGTGGLSGQTTGLEHVRIGNLDATVVQPALVDLALQIFIKLRDDKAFKPLAAYEVEPVVVVPKNVEQMLRVGTYKLPRL